MIKNIQILLSLIVCLFCVNINAHKRWLLPTDFLLSDAETVTVDFTASNNIFYVDIGMPLAGVRAFSPAGEIPLLNSQQGTRRSSFDIEVDQAGTYRVFADSPPLYFVSYQLPGNSEPQGDRGSLEQLKADLPTNAQDVRFMKAHALIETYITLGAETISTNTSLDNNGLRMKPVTHPNTLYSDEPAKFRMLFKGQPAKALKVSIVPDGTRYRDQQAEIGLMTDDSGFIEINWPAPGRYLVEASIEESQQQGEIAVHYYSYFLTLEVLAP